MAVAAQWLILVMMTGGVAGFGWLAVQGSTAGPVELNLAIAGLVTMKTIGASPALAMALICSGLWLFVFRHVTQAPKAKTATVPVQRKKRVTTHDTAAKVLEQGGRDIVGPKADRDSDKRTLYKLNEEWGGVHSSDDGVRSRPTPPPPNDSPRRRSESAPYPLTLTVAYSLCAAGAGILVARALFSLF